MIKYETSSELGEVPFVNSFIFVSGTLLIITNQLHTGLQGYIFVLVYYPEVVTVDT